MQTLVSMLFRDAIEPGLKLAELSGYSHLVNISAHDSQNMDSGGSHIAAMVMLLHARSNTHIAVDTPVTSACSNS
jgi:hypothetical protein